MIDRDAVLLIVLPVLAGVVSALCGQRSSRVYWGAATGFVLVACILSVSSESYEQLPLRWSLAHFTLFFLVPAGAAFWAGRVTAVRARPLASLVVAPVIYLAAVVTMMTLSINLGVSK